MHRDSQRRTLPPVGNETGKELANLYLRGVEEGYSGELMAENAQAILDILDVFGEDGVRTYLVGVLEGNEDAVEDELDELDEQAIREEHEEDGDDEG